MSRDSRESGRAESLPDVVAALAALSRAIRGRKQLSQEEVARRGGISAKLVLAVEHERANPTLGRLDRLAKGLGLSGVGELLTQVDAESRRDERGS